jgi:hypothetical protein
MARGFSDAGGFVFGWFQGYHEPMNSIRLVKSFFLALLLVPPWRREQSHYPELTSQLLAYSLVVGLAAASLTTVWERQAFTGLLNFSSDYRTTGMFWEMHVGGAALDGFLAITVPFAVAALLAARSTLSWSTAAVALALAAYASLTTFSRGVYLAVPVGVLVVAVLRHLQQSRRVPPSDGGPIGAGASAPSDSGAGNRDAVESKGTLAGLALVVAFGTGAAWMFHTSGYRGMATLLATVALMLPLTGLLRRHTVNRWLAGVAVACLLVPVVLVIAWAMPKGAYLAWALAAALTTATLLHARRRGRRARNSAALALAGFVAVAVATALVGQHWGGAPGLRDAVPVLLILLAIGLVASLLPRPLWPDTARWQATTIALMSVVAATVGVFGGGAYMGDRFATAERDMEGRLSHWALGRDMLRTPSEWIWGKGMGRFPANYFLSGKPEQHPGDYRLKSDGRNAYLTIAGGLHTNGWGEIFRVTQRIAEPGKDPVVNAMVRADRDVALHFEVCEKHLLYGQVCTGNDVGIKGQPGFWQSLSVELKGAEPRRGDWYAPRLIAFSVAMDTKGRHADLDKLTLTRSDGQQLLSNGDFAEGMAHWFFSSDKYHLPWHTKNMLLHVLFDQGLVGAGLLLLLLFGAMWRTTFGTARNHSMAPALAAGITAFLTVGLFDSLLDVPRLAWLFYFLLMVSLLLPSDNRKTGMGPGLWRAGWTLALMLSVVSTGIAIQPSQAFAAENAGTPQRIQVGPDRTIRSIGEASRLARNDALIEVDAGVYLGDVAVWSQDRLTLRAVGGRVQLKANGNAAEGKAIWVVRASQFTVEGFDFTGAEVADHNGAGIRLESGSMRVVNCRFIDNENGILTSNHTESELDIVDSEFAHNGYGDGLSHNLYVGAIARLSVSGSYFHHAIVGHLLKSRAAVNDIRYNRLTDEPGGRASYELEFPNGGLAYVVGNIIEQGVRTENPNLIAYGSEGYRWTRNALYLVNNTLVDDKPTGGVLLRVKPGDVTIKAVNNLVVGAGNLEIAGPGVYRNNVKVDRDAFESIVPESYRPRRDARLNGKLADPGTADGVNLQPEFQYRPPVGKQPLKGKPHNPGALQSIRP